MPLIGVFAEATRQRGGPASPTPTPTPAPGFDWSNVDAPIDTTLFNTTFFQARDGTNQTTGDLQDIRCIKHPSTGSIVWQSPLANPENCWRLRIIGGVPYLQPKNLGAGAESALEFAKGITSGFFQWGLAGKINSFGSNTRIFCPRVSGTALYISTHNSPNQFNFWNGGGSADFKDTGVTAGAARVYDGYCGDGSTTPQAWARFRIGTTNTLLNGGLQPNPTNGPGSTTLDGIRFGGPSAPGSGGFGGDPADVLIRAAYFHQAANNAGMLPEARMDAINAWMQGLTI